jgi:hypothetical protein
MLYVRSKVFSHDFGSFLSFRAAKAYEQMEWQVIDFYVGGGRLNEDICIDERTILIQIMRK